MCVCNNGSTATCVPRLAVEPRLDYLIVNSTQMQNGQTASNFHRPVVGASTSRVGATAVRSSGACADERILRVRFAPVRRCKIGHVEET